MDVLPSDTVVCQCCSKPTLLDIAGFCLDCVEDHRQPDVVRVVPVKTDHVFRVTAPRVPVAAISTVPALSCCEVCLDTVTKSWKCPENHTFCHPCMSNYLCMRIKEGNIDTMPCPQVGCSVTTLPDATLRLFLSAQSIKELVALRRIREDSRLRACPSCSEAVLVHPSSLDVVCPSCSVVFCYFHGTSSVTASFLG